MRGWVERRMAPFADMLGWRPVFDIDRVLVCEDLKLMEKRRCGLGPFHDDALPQGQRAQGCGLDWQASCALVSVESVTAYRRNGCAQRPLPAVARARRAP